MNDSYSFSEKIFSFIKQFFVMVLYLFLDIFLVVLCYKSIMSPNNLIANLSGIFTGLFILTIFIFIFRKTFIPDYYDFKINLKKYLRNNWKYYLYGLLAMAISNLIVSKFIGMPTNEEANRQILFEMPIYSIISLCIFAPFTEELMTRILLNKVFKNPYIYALFSALIFGSLHLLAATSLLEFLYIIPYSALGFSLALIYRKSNNIWTNIFFHSFHNFVAIILIFVGV